MESRMFFCSFHFLPPALQTMMSEWREHCIMGPRPSRPVRTTQVFAVCFLNVINRRTQAATHSHSYVQTNRQIYHHNGDAASATVQESVSCTKHQITHFTAYATNHSQEGNI